MNKALSILLSLTLIYGSITPSLAQGGFGKGIIRGVSTAKTLSPATLNALQGIVSKTASISVMVPVRYLATGVVSTTVGKGTMAAKVARGVRVNPNELKDVASLQFTPKQALETLQNFRETKDLAHLDIAYLNVFPHLNITRGFEVTNADRVAALNHYRRAAMVSLNPKNQSGSANEWGRNMAAISNLGIYGTATDAELIIRLSKAVPAEFTAYTDVIASRALLSLNVPGKLQELAALRTVNGTLPAHWQGIADYAKAHALPVELPAVAEGKVPALTEEAKTYLQKWNPLNLHHENTSAQATEDWLSLREGANARIISDEAGQVITEGSARPTIQNGLKIETPAADGLALNATEIPAAAGGNGAVPPEPPTAVAGAEEEAAFDGNVDNLISRTIENVYAKYKQQPVQSEEVYATILKEELTAAFKAAKVSPSTKDAMASLAVALEELPLTNIARREIMDAVSGRQLTWLQKAGRKVMAFFSPKQVKSPTAADIDVLEEKVLETLVANSVRADLQAVRSAINSSEAPLVTVEEKSFNRKDADGQEITVKYNREVYDYAKVLRDYVGSALRVTGSPSTQLGFAPQTLETGLADFPFMHTNILLKSREGLTQKRIYTVAVSDKDKIFKDLKKGWTLVVDTYGNLYRTNGVKKVYYHDKKVTTVVLKNLGNMPVVVIQSVPNRLGALNNVFTIMGFSSTGRFLKDAMKNEYRDVLGPSADSWATALTTGIYFTNLAAFLYQPLIKKYGARPVLTGAVSAILSGSLLPVLATAMGASPEVSMASVISAFLLTGLGGAGIQQIANPTAKQLLRGKDAGSIVSAGQVWKSVGSLMTYGAFAAAVALLGAPWQAMYGILALPAVSALVKLLKADLPLAQAEKKVAKASEVQAELSKMAEKGQMSWKKFMADPKVWSIFGGLLAFCGSETMVSVATKGMINKSLAGLEGLSKFYGDAAEVLAQAPWMQGIASANVANAFETFLTGMATMAPVLFGRMTATKLMQKFSSVPKYNQKMMTISGVTALASIATLYGLGPNAGPLALIPVVLTNGLLGNMFTFSFNIMKDHDKTKYNNAYSTLTGTLSTSAVVACCLIPTLASLIMPETAANMSTIAFDRMIIPLALIGGAMTVINMFHHANPFSWRKPASQEVVAARQEALFDRIGILLPQADTSTLAKLLAEEFSVPEAFAAKELQIAISRVKTDMAKAARIGADELDAILVGENNVILSEEALDKMAGTLGVRTGELKKMVKGDEKVIDQVGHKIMNRVRQLTERLIKNKLKGIEDGNDLDLGDALPN